MKTSKIIDNLCEEMFPNGGESYNYRQLREFIVGQGYSARQACGVVGNAVRRGYITVAHSEKGHSIFTR